MIWQSKPLARRDLNVPDEDGTHPTGSINLDHGLLPEHVDHRHFFYDQVFAALEWTPRSDTVVEARATFELIVMGAGQGEYRLPIRHTTSTDTRSYEQHNAMTRLSWAEAKGHITDPALIGRTLSLYRSTINPARFRVVIA